MLHISTIVLIKIVSEYDQEIPQSRTADKPMVPLKPGLGTAASGPIR